MACPMRFILLGVSLVIAWFAYWQCSKATQAASMEAQKEQQLSHQQCSGARLKQAALTLLDMFSGKYLYNIIRERRLPQPHTAGKMI